MNSVEMIGNLTKDVELRHTQTGKSVAKFTVAVNRTIKGQNGEERQIADYIPVVAWGYLADAAPQELHKGSLVYVEGRFTTRSYEAQDGTKRYTTEVVANIIAKPIGAAKQQSQNGGGSFSRFGAPQATGYTAPAYTQEDIPF